MSLAVTAFLTRRGGLPTDGLWFDDSWVAAGVVKGSLSQLMMVGSGHPGFTAGLMAWSGIIGDDARSLGYAVLLAGTLGPPLLYAALRRFGYARSICALLSAALLVADIHILYSGRVKAYALDPALVLGLAVVVPRLARVTWRWPTAVAWAVAAILVGSCSGFVLVATAGAGAILFLHPASDRIVRSVAVTAQAIGHLSFFVVVQRSSDLTDLELTEDKLYDGHVDFFLNPVRFGGEVLEHLRRVAMVYPGGSGRWLTPIVLVALAGLIVAALTRRTIGESLRARYLLLIISIAFIGGLVGKFPFGTTGGTFLSSGGRHSLWLVPAMAIGLAAVLHRLRRLAVDHTPLRVGFDVLVLAGAALVVVSGYDTPVAYPYPGSASATEFVESALGPHDVALITQTSIYTFAHTTDVPVWLRATPDRQIGYLPDFADPRIRTIGGFGEVPGTPAQIRAMVADADRIFVHESIQFGPRALGVLNGSLAAEGFQPEQRREFAEAVVVIWRR